MPQTRLTPEQRQERAQRERAERIYQRNQQQSARLARLNAEKGVLVPIEPTPYSGPVIRHLAMHLWPRAATQTWKTNLDRLLSRIHLFNGDRRISIVTDGDTVHPDDVMRHLDGHRIIFTVKPNRKLTGEVESYFDLFEPLETSDPNQTVFYCHSKGSRHPLDRVTVHRWASAMWETNLDHIGVVDCELQSHVFAGSFKQRQRMGRDSDWRYSGTFYWTRSLFFFKRPWRTIHKRFFGMESLPGKIAHWDEGHCLFGEHAGNLYDEATMKQAEAELALWRVSNEADSSVRQP